MTFSRVVSHPGPSGEAAQRKRSSQNVPSLPERGRFVWVDGSYRPQDSGVGEFGSVQLPNIWSELENNDMLNLAEVLLEYCKTINISCYFI